MSHRQGLLADPQTPGLRIDVLESGRKRWHYHRRLAGKTSPSRYAAAGFPPLRLPMRANGQAEEDAFTIRHGMLVILLAAAHRPSTSRTDPALDQFRQIGLLRLARFERGLSGKFRCRSGFQPTAIELKETLNKSGLRCR
ncbi:MAG: hypothetical protein P4M05_33855 [Bradyrhizobium sp.]|nr:hypothetical protein [Bradyrhizobium sp.]